MKYSLIEIWLQIPAKNKIECEKHKTVPDFATVSPFNNSWNFYDLDGILRAYNWDNIIKIIVTQKEE